MPAGDGGLDDSPDDSPQDPPQPDSLPDLSDLSAPPDLSDYLDLSRDTPSSIDGTADLRLLTRSPHPYHHSRANIPHPADRVATLSAQTATAVLRPRPRPHPSTSPSDSGTEADDEHFLRGLPAPRTRPHKGLRGMDEVLSSGVSTPLLLSPLLSPAVSRSDIAALGAKLASSEAAAGGSDRHVVGGGRCGRGPPRLQANSLDTGYAGDNGARAQPNGHVVAGEDAAALLDSHDRHDHCPSRGGAERSRRRRREIVRRSAEVLILVSLAGLLLSNPDVRPLVVLWRNELQATSAVVLGVLALYPVRVAFWTDCRRRRRWTHQGRNSREKEDKMTPSPTEPPRGPLVVIPASFDPAPLLYPLAVPLLVSLLLATPTLPAAPLLNMALCLCTLPRPLIPLALPGETYAPVQWALSCVPAIVAARFPSPRKATTLGVPFSVSSSPTATVLTLTPEMATFLCPLHQTLCWLLHDLTTTSLLPAELQLLSVALLNLLLLAASPQAVILQALLWGGGLGILLTCSGVVRWGIALARVPRWRFRKETRSAPASPTLAPSSPSSMRAALGRVWAWIKSPRRARLELMFGSADRYDWDAGASAFADCRPPRAAALGGADHEAAEPLAVSNADGALEVPPLVSAAADDDLFATRLAAQPDQQGLVPLKTTKSHTHNKQTPSGRRKRAASSSLRGFFALTHQQAVRRRRLYAGYLYACVLALVLGPVRWYIGAYALGGHEPLGWALGYLLGDLSAFRLEVVKAQLEGWVCLPERVVAAASSPAACAASSCQAGWVEHVRRASLGAASTRLAISAYWLAILVAGLAVVLTLSPVYEVDTRRKVFHFTMVAMLLPATFVDPAFAALALALVLAAFLLLDLLRASQLPPLSRPLAAFLAPYVDGRDLRGPVVISHIFLLVGCALPLWLSLAALPRGAPGGGGSSRVGDGMQTRAPFSGWDLPTRDISMVAGVVCVGLGDAAASLIGRRWGRRKWLWGGGKSLEGSAAFATAVFAGLLAASVWLCVGGWPVTPAATAAPSPDRGGGLLDGLNSADRLDSLARAWTVLRAQWTRTVPRAGVCAAMASLTEAVLTGGNDNVVVPVILWTCVKSLGL